MSESNTTHVSAEETREMESHTDWERLRTFSDEEIAQAVDEDPDAMLLDEEWFETAVVLHPSRKHPSLEDE